jgi:hypothetical protein
MEVEEKNKHLVNLVEKIVSDLNSKVKTETEPATILLKGHLLLENLLEEVLAVFDLQKKQKISRLSFYEKIKLLSGTNSGNNINPNIKEACDLLFSLNEVRNNLAHDLNFKISESDINKIGINLGSEYIIKKYEIGYKKIADNLIFLLEKTVRSLGLILFIKIELLKSIKNSPKLIPEQKQAVVTETVK